MKIVILAGGGGTRLWPVSRKRNPKQMQPFIGSKTLLQKTYERQRRGFATKDIFISTNYKSYPAIQKQLPRFRRENCILETAKRDTAAAIGLAAAYIAKGNPQEIMMTVGSDHYVRNEREYIRLLRLAERTVKNNPAYSLLVGVRPGYPETGYGYVKINKLFQQAGSDEIFYGLRFIEKPDLKTAQAYARSWDYLWNTNMFCWRVDYLLSMFKRHLPNHYRILMKLQPALGTKQERKAVEREFKKLKPISIDYGIMERTLKLLVIPASFGWADVGHWRAVKDILATKAGANVVRGKHLTVDSTNNLVYSYTGKLIATVDVNDMIIIDTEDCLLVCSRDRAQDVKKIVEQLKKKSMTKYL
ncbi:MAG: sugar phosphate nucleotidyltransferase [Patescibacteria group bacterium]